jgi:aldehyde dehydrogenase (NAD+)
MNRWSDIRTRGQALAAAFSFFLEHYRVGFPAQAPQMPQHSPNLTRRRVAGDYAVDGFNPDLISVGSANNFIAGCRVQGRGEGIVVRRPSDGRVQAELDCADAGQLAEAVENAQAAYKKSGWAQTDPRGRMKVLRRWAELIDADAETLAPLEALGSTRTIGEINGWDLSYTAETVRFFADA